MRTRELQFDGIAYVCRMIKSNDGDELIIGPTDLLGALQPGSFNDQNEGFVNDEARQLYDEVFYFTDTASLRLPDDELIDVLKESNPEWFD